MKSIVCISLIINREGYHGIIDLETQSLTPHPHLVLKHLSSTTPRFFSSIESINDCIEELTGTKRYNISERQLNDLIRQTDLKYPNDRLAITVIYDRIV